MATFRQFSSGRWQARVFMDGSYRSIGTFLTKKEAEIRAAEIERKLFYSETITDRDMLFQELIDNWFENKKRSVKESTLEQLEVIKRLHIEPFFAKRRLYRITRDDVIEWIDEARHKVNKKGEPKYSHGTLLKHLKTLKDIFYYGVNELEILDKSPAQTVQVPRRNKHNISKNIKYYNLTELNLLLDYLFEYDPPRFKNYKMYYVLVFFLSRTGLRISEALALRWSDIDGNRVDINKQTSRDNNNNITISTLKTKSSYRNIEIDEDTVHLLNDFRKVQQKMIMKYKTFKRNKDMIIFQTYNGNYLTPSIIRDTLKNHCLHAGVEYKGTHAFRHTHAVLSLEAGAELLYISRRLGHGSIQTTADTYLDVTPQLESEELDKISAHFNSNMAKSRRIDDKTK